MKSFVLLQGGLGNQMFQYAFFLYASQYIEISCDKSLYKINAQHNNCELEKLFSIENIENNFSYITLKFFFNKYFNDKTSKCLLNIRGYELILDSSQLENNFLKKPSIFKGYWQSLNFVDPIQKQLKEVFRFDLHKLNKSSIRISENIKACNSVSIHIRRGDYLKFNSLYGGICTSKYYINAINYIKKYVVNPVFFIFSDDYQWVTENLDLQDEHVFVDCNKGSDSWQDMYLMAQCSHNIIANSTFSWWGAWLNLNEQKIVVCPSKFDNKNTANLICEKWIVVES